MLTGDPFLGDLRRYNFVFSDGSAVSIYSTNAPQSLNSSFGVIYIDVNGIKGPSTFGKDMFQFDIFPNRLLPGSADYDYRDLVDECLDSGFPCSQLVIMNDNLDYQNCPDEFKTGATKCSK